MRKQSLFILLIIIGNAAAGQNLTPPVGIGTTSPQAPLHIVNNQNLVSLVIEGNSAGWGSGFTLNNTAAAGKQYGIYSSAYGHLHFSDNMLGVDRMLINSSGNVGIGTNNISDVNYKLFVETGIRTRKVKVDSNIWPDYVFSNEYRLRPLSEVESYIIRHKHLPDVPSAAEVKKEGLDLGENQATLLRKIEELTLYIIEQQKEIKELKKEMQALKTPK